MSACITSLYHKFGLPIFLCPLTSILIVTHYYISALSHYKSKPSQSRMAHFISYPCHTCCCSYFFYPDLLNPFIPIIHLNILVSVLSSNSCYDFLGVQVSLSLSRTSDTLLIAVETLTSLFQISYLTSERRSSVRVDRSCTSRNSLPSTTSGVCSYLTYLRHYPLISYTRHKLTRSVQTRGSNI